MTLHSTIDRVTDRIIARSEATRRPYLDRMEAARAKGPARAHLSCSGQAHAYAASGADKDRLATTSAGNLGIVTTYNDMLSAHQPFERYPELIRDAVRAAGGTAQVAGGVPAMCDGVTQGEAGMELSLFSRDVIALAASVALSHNTFDAAVYLGVCDKIVPGLVIAAQAFGHLPAVFLPAGPMESGLSNDEKAKVRQQFAAGEVGRDALMAAEMAAYHGPGTCTFYGTANTNQMMMEMTGLHLPGAAFVHPNTPLRDALTAAAAQRAVEIIAGAEAYTPMARVVDEKSLVNAMVGLMATGGSTNHTLHMVAIARAAGIILTWSDFDDISRVVPLIARVYPNGSEDVNAFQAAGGMAFVIRQLLDAGLAHDDVVTVAGGGLRAYQREPFLEDGRLVWREGPETSLNLDILRPVSDPFQAEGGLRLMAGGLGRAVMKTSAVKVEHHVIEAPARVFDDQDALLEAFRRGELTQDFVAVVRFQGPKANGMPELHSLTPTLGVLLDRGLKVALVTDGRMSGASGKVPAAIHVTPEAADGGPLSRVRDGDLILVDARTGRLEIKVDAAELAAREPARACERQTGFGRELFGWMRRAAGPAEAGASVLFEEVA